MSHRGRPAKCSRCQLSCILAAKGDEWRSARSCAEVINMVEHAKVTLRQHLRGGDHVLVGLLVQDGYVREAPGSVTDTPCITSRLENYKQIITEISASFHRKWANLHGWRRLCHSVVTSRKGETSPQHRGNVSRRCPGVERTFPLVPDRTDAPRWPPNCNTIIVLCCLLAKEKTPIKMALCRSLKQNDTLKQAGFLKRVARYKPITSQGIRVIFAVNTEGI